jgi:tripeptidyl-peptidase-1
MLKLLCHFALISIVYAKTSTIFLNTPSALQQKVFQLASELSDPDSSTYGQYLLAKELQQLTCVEGTAEVENWLSQQTTVTYANYGDSFEIYGSTDNVAYLLNKIPPSVLPYIYYIEGITNTNFNKRHAKHISKSHTQDVTPDSGYVGRETILRLYDISQNLTITTPTSVALIEFSDGGFGRSDYETALRLNGVHSTTQPVVIGEDNSAGTESSLDVQMVGITAQNVSLWYIDYDDTQWIASFAVNVSNMVNPPHVCSVSYGWSSFYQCQIVSCGNLTSADYISLSNYHLAKLALRGVTVCVSSGDSGAPSRADEMCSDTPSVQAEFPSASPWVLSVGGMFIVNDTTLPVTNSTPFCQKYSCASGNQTWLVQNTYVGWGSGSGFTPIDNRSDFAPWQVPLVAQYMTTNVSFPDDYNQYGVSRPDVVAVAHNGGIMMGGSILSVDGTSMSSPIMAGMIGLMVDKRLRANKPALGFVNPLFYNLASQSTFTSGYTGNTADTEAQECPPNYGFFTDGTTPFSNPVGLGSPVFSQLYAAI